MKRRSFGFSLIELSLVIAIISVALLFIVPSLPLASNRSLPKDIQELAHALQGCKTRAMLSGKTQTFSINLNTRQWAAGGKSGSFAANTQIAVVYGVQSLSDAQAPEIRFFADGNSTGGQIRISKANAHKQINVQWLNATVRVSDAQP